MNKFATLFWSTSSSSILALLLASISQAQPIKIDGTIPQTQLEGDCSTNCLIRGGLQHGQNLFHSFSRFNVESGAVVRFEASSATNIFSRVTVIDPSNTSRIEGVLGVSNGSSANLFLINPNGIQFVGSEAGLDLNGSFVATTAHAIGFGDQGRFEAKSSQIPLLTVQPSALIFNGQNSSISSNLASLDSLGNHIALVGGRVDLSNSKINVSSSRDNNIISGGRIDIGGLLGSGTVALNINAGRIEVFFPKNIEYSDISITKTQLEIFGNGSDNLTLQGKNVFLDSVIISAGIFGQDSRRSGDVFISATDTLKIESSNIFNAVTSDSIGEAGDIVVTSKELFINGSNLNSSTFGFGDAGSINLNSKSNIYIDASSRLDSAVATNAEGKAGGIQVNAENLSLENNSVINASTAGQGDSGNIVLKVSESISLKDSAITSLIRAGGLGNSDDIEIHSKKLILTEGSQVSTAVNSSSISDSLDDINQGGNIIANVRDYIVLSGYSLAEGFSSGIVSATQAAATGSAGDIKITTNSLRVEDGAIVSAQTLNLNEGGSIDIYARTIEAINGGQILTDTFFSGTAGNITLNVTDRILLSGREANFKQRQEKFPEVVANAADGRSGIFANARAALMDESDTPVTGQAGSIFIDPQLLILDNGARIAVNNEGSAPGGNLDIVADTLFLNNQSEITAASSSSMGGDINITAPELLRLDNNSRITASAGEALGAGDGGNIDIDAAQIVALNGSRIVAEAFTGSGGRIDIDTSGVFLWSEEAISASSAQGPDGIVTINDPEADPSRGVLILPEEASSQPQFAQRCRPGQALGGGELVNKGRAGRSRTPQEQRVPKALWHDIRTFAKLASSPSSQGKLRVAPTASRSHSVAIVEAHAWSVNPQGQLQLVATAPTPQLAGSNPDAC